MRQNVSEMERLPAVAIKVVLIIFLVVSATGLLLLRNGGDGMPPGRSRMPGVVTPWPTSGVRVFEVLAASALEATSRLARTGRLPDGVGPEAERSIRRLVEPNDQNATEEANARITRFEPARPVVWHQARLPDGYSPTTTRVLEANFKGGMISHEAAGFSPASEADLEGERFQVLLELRDGRWVITDVALGYEVDGD